MFIIFEGCGGGVRGAGPGGFSGEYFGRAVMRTVVEGLCLPSLVGGAWGFARSRRRITIELFNDFGGTGWSLGLLSVRQPFHIIKPF